MKSFVLRRSLPSVGLLLGLLLLVGGAGQVGFHLPVWFPVAFAIGMVLLEFAVNPWIIQWLVRAHVIPNDGHQYLTDDPIGALVARRAADAGVPLPKLGIVDDGTPNAFTFGRHPGDARLWISRGLVERLDERELDAVIAHEMGHIRHWDFVVMTVAAVVPMILYLIWVLGRNLGREAKVVAVGAYVAYVISQFTVLALSRARELGADHWSCACTGDGDALASALVKVAYGIGQVQADQRGRIAALTEGSKDDKREATKVKRRVSRGQALHAMGIFEPRQAEAMAAALAGGVDPDRAVAGMRWDQVNPWGKALEKLSSHPLVATRIIALERSGLAGAPRTWSLLRASAVVDDPTRARLGARFRRELAVAVVPWVLLVAIVGFGAAADDMAIAAAGVFVAGLGLVVKQRMRFPGGFRPVPQITDLLGELDASPVHGTPVVVRGMVAGRAMPGLRAVP